MQLLKILTLTLGFSLATAAPPGQKANGCVCAGTVYPAPTVASAILAGNNMNSDPKSSAGTYPHLFNNREKLSFPNCKSGFIEFPLIQGGFWNPKTKPGPDRVVYQKGGKFCGCMTHTGAPTKNGFVACTH